MHVPPLALADYYARELAPAAGDFVMRRQTLAFWDFPKPLVAAINGLAVGGGANIARETQSLLQVVFAITHRFFLAATRAAQNLYALCVAVANYMDIVICSTNARCVGKTAAVVCMPKTFKFCSLTSEKLCRRGRCPARLAKLQVPVRGPRHHTGARVILPASAQ